ncbi:MAG: oleate hydratase [Deltaproteobacteria bacterium HGW-Deltaproteobacteria-2]|nr:MAG: oleate hydratase [Deltaproteobacteria bacterium HGW-Deltaproteobacteria-2]
MKKTGIILLCLLIGIIIVFFSVKGYFGTHHPVTQVTQAPVTANSQIYIVGGGLAGLAAAVYAIQDANIPGKNIHILEELNVAGGALDSKGGTHNVPYAARGARLLDPEAHRAYRAWLTRIPSLADQQAMEKLGGDGEALKNYKVKKTLSDELDDFWATHKLNSITRLVGKDQRRIDHFKFGLSMGDKWDLLVLISSPEDKYHDKRIGEYFQPSFFKSNFWYMFSSVFGFQQWHSLTEMRRYVRNFFQSLDTLSDLKKTGMNAEYNSYDAVVVPTVKWLRTRGVNFDMGCKVTDVDFKPTIDEKTVQKIHYIQNGVQKDIMVNYNDFVFISIGSKTADSREGSMHIAPILEKNKVDGAWTLWENMAKKQPGLGNPLHFTNSIDHSKFVVFNVTTKGKLLEDLIMKFTKNKRFGEQHMVIFPESPWNLIVHIPWQPFVRNQDKDTTIIMAYALKGDNEGEYVKKKMGECTGEELLTEMCYQFGFMNELPEILKSSECIPFMLPYVTSMFLPRNQYDRPPVIPDRSTNLALIGEFTEMPEDTVFMVSYSTKTAQTAVYKLLHVNKEITPIYRGTHNVWNWIKVLYWL